MSTIYLLFSESQFACMYLDDFRSTYVIANPTEVTKDLIGTHYQSTKK